MHTGVHNFKERKGYVLFEGHLHTHTEFSTLDGMSRIEELILRAKELGQTGIAITDHGSSSGLFKAWKLGKKHDFNMLLGEEFYFDNKSEVLKTGHLILIAKNEKGLENIFRLQAAAQNNFYYKPRIDFEMLQEFNEGLICTTACIANAVGQLILHGENDMALQHILKLKEIFGDDLYVELQSSSLPDVRKVNEVLEDFIIGYDLKCIVTTDIHYVYKSDYEIHEIWLAMQQQKKMSDPKRWRFETNDYYLKSEKEMKDGLNVSEEVWKKCCNNISEVFEKCKGVDFQISDHLPHLYPSKSEEDIELENRTWEGYINKVAARGENNNKFASDIHKELKVIEETGYSGYFLVVQEYIKWARENGIQVSDGRGSGAGCKVAYALDIHDVNPDEENLLFERFLTPGRTPDVDADFSDIDAVFRHLQDKYGKTNVARVGAYTTFTCKAGLRKLMSTFGFNTKDINSIIKLLPDDLKFTLEEAVSRSAELKKWLSSHQLIYTALSRLEGIVEHHSTHAGGVVICKDLTSLLPVMTNSDDREKLIIALDKKEIEELGHYKFDILGLESLTVMQNAIEYVDGYDKHSIDYEDPNIYEMLCSGDVLGVFQLADQRDKVVEQHPTCFKDLIAINALIRPGVCDWKEYMKERNSHTEKDVLPFMQETHGLIVYQEQYLLLAQHYAGWDLAFSDNHIRKNKNLANDVELKEKWMKDTNGMEDLWNQIVSIVGRGYSFNKSHATAYAKLSFQTAYMKYYHPKEFYAALLTQKINDVDKLSQIIKKVQSLGVSIINPDINISTDRFIPTDKGIMMPINSVKGVGGSAVYEVNRLRPIQDFDDFIARRIPKFVKRTTIVSLIYAGAFDFTGKSKKELLDRFEEDIEHEELKPYEYEKMAFGFYLTATPFDEYYVPEFNSLPDGNAMTIVEITELKERLDKKGRTMAFATGVNNTDNIKLIFFSSIWGNVSLEEGEIVFIKGKKDKGSLLVNTVEKL